MNPRAVGMLAVGLAVLCVASPVARRVTWAVARGLGHALLGLLALVVMLTRNQREDRRPDTPDMPTTAPAAGPVAWQAVLYVIDPVGHRHVLGRGAVPGQFPTAYACEAAVMHAYVQRHGLPENGRLCCRAEPATAPTTTHAARPEGTRR